MQREGLDYLDIFSPTPILSATRMIATIALHHDWTINHWNIEQVFVQSCIDGDTVVKLPEGCRYICPVRYSAPE